FVKNGRKFHLKPLEKSAESGKVNWLWMGNIVEGRPGPSSECMAGDSIEIDAPVGSNFDLSGRAARTAIDSVKRVKVKIVEGVITLRNITGGINAYTSQGDVMVENSGGAISLQKVEHRQIEASSISGSLLFDGKFLTGGIYNFRTSNGSIRLAIPALSSCTFTTTYGEGAFHSEIPLKILTENVTPRAKIVVSKIGTGEATVNLTTSNGSISIRKTV